MTMTNKKKPVAKINPTKRDEFADETKYVKEWEDIPEKDIPQIHPPKVNITEAEIKEFQEFMTAKEKSEHTTYYECVQKMQSWLKRVPFPEFVRTMQKRVIGQEDMEDILFNIYMYISNLSQGRSINNNILLAAPSGCGKTETFRALQQYFAIEIPCLPIIQIDLSEITPEGYVGGSVKDIIKPLISSGSDGMGIVFMDEFDKCLIPQFLQGKTQLNQEVQNALLTLIEGRDIDNHINTGRTMFIGMGAFDVFRRKRECTPSSIGFANGKEGASVSDTHYEPITIEDLRESGAIPELLGRFVTIINYHKLSDEAVDKIIDLSVKNLSSTFGMPISISKDVRAKLHDLSNTEYGCRLIYNTLHNNICKVLKRYLYEGKNLNQVFVYLETI